ncbi:hypothetical protein THII_1101 [Thioploca ingrica]|uniref:Uncharacterized protein n=1 Tax=Thioploca ingrica TaxID=40754 RepID=A0A090ACF1_9GAMM|nr:hypothetical protein THII_1101 [Thioploca ingrica]
MKQSGIREQSRKLGMVRTTAFGGAHANSGCLSKIKLVFEEVKTPPTPVFKGGSYGLT